MRVIVRLLEETANRCLQLSTESQHEKASRVMRLLAVDLMLAAEQRRHNRGPGVSEQLAELGLLSRVASKSPAKSRTPRPERKKAPTRESALTA
jgi:hypothetical protein